MTPSISLLIPSFNRAEVIKHVWQSWLEQEYVAQVVLIDDGSTEDYAPLLAFLKPQFAERGVELTYLRNEERIGSPASKNKGLAVCTGSHILTTDDDIILAKGMCQRLWAFSRVHPNDVIGARIVYLKDDETVEQSLKKADSDTRPYCNTDTMTLTPWVLTPNEEAVKVPFVTAVALWPRKLFDQGLRYFEAYGGNGYREETDPQITAQSRYGAQVWYLPTALCYHLPPHLAYSAAGGQRRGGMLWFEYWVLKNNFVFFKRHGEFLKRCWGISTGRATRALLAERFSTRRLKLLLKKVAGR